MTTSSSVRGAVDPRLAACVPDPDPIGIAAPLRRVLQGLPAETLANPRGADPSIFAPIATAMEHDPHLRWSILQRAFMVRDVDSLQAYIAAALDFDASASLASIRCPTFIACEENDPLARTAPDVYAALTAPKALQHFATAEGAGDHCAIMARSLFLAHMFDWLVGTVRRAASADSGGRRGLGPLPIPSPRRP